MIIPKFHIKIFKFNNNSIINQDNITNLITVNR